jgi:hypothetical protein
MLSSDHLPPSDGRTAPVRLWEHTLSFFEFFWGVFLVRGLVGVWVRERVVVLWI